MIILYKGDQSVQLRTTFVVYLCIERSEGGAKGTPRTLGDAPIIGNLVLLRKISPKQTNTLNIDVSRLLIGPMPVQGPLMGSMLHFSCFSKSI